MKKEELTDEEIITFETEIMDLMEKWTQTHESQEIYNGTISFLATFFITRELDCIFFLEDELSDIQKEQKAQDFFEHYNKFLRKLVDHSFEMFNKDIEARAEFYEKVKEENK
jgi:hypothetical protein